MDVSLQPETAGQDSSGNEEKGRAESVGAQDVVSKPERVPGVSPRGLLDEWPGVSASNNQFMSSECRPFETGSKFSHC